MFQTHLREQRVAVVRAVARNVPQRPHALVADSSVKRTLAVQQSEERVQPTFPVLDSFHGFYDMFCFSELEDSVQVIQIQNVVFLATFS